MPSALQRKVPALVLFVGLVSLLGCEDTDLTAPTDGQITVTANPATVVLDPENDVDEGSSTIAAQVFDATGRALPDVAVFFTTNGGQLASASSGTPQPVSTNTNGVATDTLTVSLEDPSTVVVTARSGTVVETVQLTVSQFGVNRPPTASISATPSGSQRINALASFRGTGTDPDGDPITCYEWTVVSSETASNETVQQPTATLNRTYTTVQQLNVTLRVSDGASCASPNFGQDTSISYNIVCDTTAPVANAGSDQSVTLSGSSVSVNLSAAASSDPESGITLYSWDCRNGQIPTGETVSCDYTATGIYDVLLTVRNGCLQTSTDTVRVTVN